MMKTYPRVLFVRIMMAVAFSTVSVNSLASTASVSFVQLRAAIPQLPTSTVAVSYSRPQIAGDLNIVVVGWNDTAAAVRSITDTQGNKYSLAVGPTKGTALTQCIYYAQNILGGRNRVIVKFDQAAISPDIRVLEYSGLDTVAPMDQTSGASGNSAITSSGPAATHFPNELIFGANTVFTGNQGAGGGFVARIITSPDSDLAEDKVVTATGNYSATASLGASGPWVMQMLALKGRSGNNVPINVSVSPSTVTLQSGQSKQFTSAVTGTSNNSVTWTAVLGSISPSGIYTAPTGGQTQDTVSAISVADSTKYASASVVIQSSDGKAHWTVANQQPVTQEYYPGTIWTTPLPADVGSHLYPHSDAIVSNMFDGDSNGSYATASVTQMVPSGNAEGNAFHYASQADPIFKIVSVNQRASNSKYDPTGKYFHFPAGATFDGTTGDTGIAIWDQSTDLDHTPGGRIFSTYIYNGGSAFVNHLPTNCTATTPSQADAQSACQLHLNYAGYDHPFKQLKPWNTSVSWTSMNDSDGARFIRLQEIMQNTMNHALMLDYQCGRSSTGNGIADGYVFPAYGAANGCSFVDSLRPLNGNLFWLDSGYDCTSLPLVQQAVCRAMQVYGGYIADTGGDQDGLFVRKLEGGIAANDKGVNSPFFNNRQTSTPAWIITNGQLSCPGGGYPKTCTGPNRLAVAEDSATSATKVVIPFFNMPGVLPHLHIIDPCIPKRMAGQPGAC
jgi:hypothetical protein